MQQGLLNRCMHALQASHFPSHEWHVHATACTCRACSEELLQCFSQPAGALSCLLGAGYRRLFDEAVLRLEGLGGRRVPVDMSSFAAAARLLYESALVAERYSGIRAFLEQNKVRRQCCRNPKRLEVFGPSHPPDSWGESFECKSVPRAECVLVRAMTGHRMHGTLLVHPCPCACACDWPCHGDKAALMAALQWRMPSDTSTPWAGPGLPGCQLREPACQLLLRMTSFISAAALHAGPLQRSRGGSRQQAGACHRRHPGTGGAVQCSRCF